MFEAAHPPGWETPYFKFLFASLYYVITEGSCLMRLLGPEKNRTRKRTALTKLIVHKNRIRQILSNGFEKLQ